jgi:hypothetical protein
MRERVLDMTSFAGWSAAELTALAKALHEARFAHEPNDSLVWQSPTVIDLHVAALQELERRRPRRPGSGAPSNGERWLRWRGRPEQEVVVRNLARDPELLQRCRDEGAPFVRALLRPFILEDADVDAILSQARATDRWPDGDADSDERTPAP